MTTTSAAARRRSDLGLVGSQLRFEQLSFWRNPVGALFTVGFSVVFLVLLGASGGTSRSSTIGHLHLIQYYVAGFLAYGVMSSCFNLLGISLVVRRENGLLKRLRLSPLPTWAMIGAIVANSIVISAVQVVLLLVIGRLGYHVVLPHNYLALIVTLVVGSLCFCSLGIAVSTLIPNQDSAGPVLGIVFYVLLFLSGLWYPLQSGSALARISGYLPVRHMITATFAPFDLRPGVSAWSGHDLLAMAIWGAVGLAVAVRRFRWEPRRG